MDVSTLIYNTLKDITHKGEVVPIFKLFYGGTAKTFITHTILAEVPAIEADDEERLTVVHATISIYTKEENYRDLVQVVRTKIKKAGFVITSRPAEIYEEDLKLYHIVTDVAITQGGMYNG